MIAPFTLSSNMRMALIHKMLQYGSQRLHPNIERVCSNVIPHTCHICPWLEFSPCTVFKTCHWWKKTLLIVPCCCFLKQGKHRITCRHQCLVVTWSFMDQLFPFWFNSPCDWFSVHYCWKISAINRAWNRGSFEYRCFLLRPCHRKTLGARRQLHVDYVASDKSCNSFIWSRDICM